MSKLKLLSLCALLQMMMSCAGSMKDTDMDGIPDQAEKYTCINDPEDQDGWEDMDGCPDPDNDGDGVCDSWVKETNQLAKFSSICKGADLCNNPGDEKSMEDMDGFEDEDGCPELDNDKDGISDKFDKCPVDAEDKDGYEDFDGCPELDNDKDGILDSLDQCPSDAEDLDGFEDKDGCPELDNDKDGISDKLDQCPNQPEDRNGYLDEDGCADGGKPFEMPAENKLVLGFTTGEAELSFEDRQTLDQFAAQLKQIKNTPYVIEVHMPLIGEQSAADYLSLLNARQKLVQDYLINRGVEGSSLQLSIVDEANLASRQDAYVTWIRKFVSVPGSVPPVQPGALPASANQF